MNPFKSSKFPVASHGLRKHAVNVPRIYTSNFYEHIPTYSYLFKKDERIDLQYSFFNRLEAMPVPALVTGRSVVRGYFVPMESIFKGWYDCQTGVIRQFPDGTSGLLPKARYFVMSEMITAFINDANVCTQVNSGDPFDFSVVDVNNVVTWYTFTPFGAAINKVFNALGYTFSWDLLDNTEWNALRLLAYIRIMLDHYFPLQYVGNKPYNDIKSLIESDSINSIKINPVNLLDAVGHLLYGYYGDGLFDSAFDNPVGNNVLTTVQRPIIVDSTNPNYPMAATSVTGGANTNPDSSYSPNNGTPYIQGSDGRTDHQAHGAITQFVLDSLQSLNNWIKRHQLSGSRVIENFLAERGVSLPSSVFDKSYQLDSFSVPFEVQDVENNSDTNLGELAGKGTVSSGGNEIRFRETFNSDGIFMILSVILPDNDTICACDPQNMAVDSLDFHHDDFDKLGVEAVPSRILYQSPQGHHNRVTNSDVFGFMPRYYPFAVDVPLAFGDFRVLTRGSQGLKQYHTFRDLYKYMSDNVYHLHHSYNFLRIGNDVSQYSRLFYQNIADNMTVIARVRGNRYTNKLPLGENYDWDDDANNRQIQVITNGDA